MDSNQLNTLYITERISTEMKGNSYKGTLITSLPKRALTLSYYLQQQDPNTLDHLSKEKQRKRTLGLWFLGKYRVLEKPCHKGNKV